VAAPDVVESYDVANGNIELRLRNLGTAACVFTIANAYDGTHVQRRVAGGESADLYVDLRAHHAWYDLRVTVDTDPLFVRMLAGHVETGRPSMSDPALGMASAE
jgi:phospholipase C